MGVVYRGHDPVIDRLVALKTISLPETLSPSERDTFLERFFLEARIAGKLTHSSIVITYDAATDEATRIPFIAMELIEGEALNQRLEDQGRLPWKEAVDIVIPVADALDYAHRNDIVHRDIKPANILLTRAGKPKITDFGIAQLPTANLTQTGVVLGTPYFMSPEQLLGLPRAGSGRFHCRSQYPLSPARTPPALDLRSDRSPKPASRNATTDRIRGRMPT